MIAALLATLVYAAVPGPVGAGETLLATHEETLPNGLRVVAHQMRATDHVSVRLELPRGAAEDPPDRPGLAHLVEHASYEAPAGEVDNAYDRRLEAVGGESQASTTHDALVFTSTVPAGVLPFALSLERERLDVEPTAEALANQRAVVARERAERGRVEDVRAALATVLWPPGHPYAHTVLGDPAALDAVTLTQLRTAMRALLAPAGGVLVVVGPHPAEEMVAEARRWFADRGGDTPSAKPTADTSEHPVEPSAETAGRRAWLSANVFHARVRVAWRTVPWTHPDAGALDLAAAVLGNALRCEETDVSHWAGRRAGALLVAADTERPAAAFARIAREVRRLSARGPSAAELTRARARSRTLALASLDTPEGRAEALATCVMRTGVADCLPRVWAEQERLDAETVRRVAERWLTPDARVLLVAASRPPFARMERVLP